jgi:molybdate transport system ATP-binding protein
MQQLLKNLRKEFPIPIVLVTHDLAEACSLADKLIVYAKGKVMQTGYPPDVLADPACAEVELLVRNRDHLLQPSGLLHPR